MIPAPLCKTAILKYLVSKETIPKLWNVSQNMRKRMKMVAEELKITLRQFNENILKLKEWVKIRIFGGKTVNSTEYINKGVFNYNLKNKEQVDKVIYLNGKLRCFSLNFKPETPLQFDFIEYLNIDPSKYDFCSECSFNQIGNLYLRELSSTQIKEIILKLKGIKAIRITNCSISDLNLSRFSLNSISLENCTFEGEIKLPSYLDRLTLNKCKNCSLLKCIRIQKLNIDKYLSEEPFDWIRSIKGLKYFDFDVPLPQIMLYLPNTIRIIGNVKNIDTEDIDLSSIKKQFPFLISIESAIPVEVGQILNLRKICPIMSESEEKFTFRPREIEILDENAVQLSKHSELFEKVERLWVNTNLLDFSCLPVGIKEIVFDWITVTDTLLDSLKKNNWKFEKSRIILAYMKIDDAVKIIKCLDKVGEISIDYESKSVETYFPQFRFTLE